MVIPCENDTKRLHLDLDSSAPAIPTRRARWVARTRAVASCGSACRETRVSTCAGSHGSEAVLGRQLGCEAEKERRVANREVKARAGHDRDVLGHEVAHTSAERKKERPAIGG